jgi:polyketide synthase PksJ
LPIRAIVSEAQSFRDFLHQVFHRLLEALEHRGFPFRQLVQALTEKHGTANELQAAFYFQRWHSVAQCRFADRLVPNIHQAGEFNLVFEVMEAPADWRLSVKYRPAHYSRAMIERLAGKFIELLAMITKNPENSLSFMLKESRSATEWGTFQYPRERCVHELIEEQVAQRAEEVAVIFRDQRLTYRELNNRANQLSHSLIRSGVQPGTLVGVMLERSLEMVIGLLAVWKAGAAYIPLDPSHPAERLAYILGDAGVELLLTHSCSRFQAGNIRVINIDGEAISGPPAPKPIVACAADHLAYVIYTSGSTGDPKGVQITHRNLTHFLWSVAQRPGCTANDYVLASTTICFDIAALELFLPLVTGARVEILPEEIVKNGLRFREKIEGSPATLVQATPAGWKMLLAAELGRIPRVKALCGGEAWDLQLAERLLARTRELWNMYGPTETTIWSSIQKVEPGQPIGLGDPIGNTQFYIFDETMRPVKPGEVGELFIGGDGLAKGYLNRPEMTQERFVPNPLRPEEVIYRTGDLVRYV